MTDAEWVKKIKVMGVEELFAEVMAYPEFLTDYYYRDLGNAIRARYDQLQAAALTPPLFLLHCGKIDSGGEQDEWDTEADSGRRVDEFARRHPGQTIGLYAGAAPTAPAPLTDEQIGRLDTQAIHGGANSQYAFRFARAIEAAHGIK